MAKKTAAKTKTSPGGGMTTFIARLPTEAIKRLKLRAIEGGVTASSLLQNAIVAWMLRHKDLAPKTLAERRGERRQFMAQMEASVVRDLKVMAIDWRVPASALVTQAVMEGLRKG